METKVVNIGPVSKDLLYIKIVDAIHAYIEASSLQPGDKLPSEREMAEVFQTSRNSVREALRVLENQGLLEVKTGRGTFLKAQPGGKGSDSVLIELVKSNFREIHELTTVLETACVRKAAKHGSQEEKQRLVKTAETMMKLREQGQFSDEADHAFHLGLADMAGNHTIAQLVKKLRLEVFGEYWGYLDYDKNGSLETVPNHLTLARAVADGDADRAAEEMDTISRHTVSIMDKAEKPSPKLESVRIKKDGKQPPETNRCNT